MTVRDGRLDIDFVARENNPLISAVEVVSTSAVARPRPLPAGGNVKVSPKSFWHASVRNAPLARNSARTAALVAKKVRDHWGGTAAFNTHQYNTPIYTVGPRQRKVRVAFHDCQGKGYLPANLFSGLKQFVDVPVPVDAVPAKGTDAAMTIYDPGADKLWGFWQMRRSRDDGWRACWGGRIDRVSTSQGVFARPYGSTAAAFCSAPVSSPSRTSAVGGSTTPSRSPSSTQRSGTATPGPPTDPTATPSILTP